MRFLKGLLQMVGLLALLAGFVGAAAFPFLGRMLESRDAPRAAEAIVLLCGNPVRAVYGAELYRQGLAPVLWVGRPASWTHKDLLDLGLRPTPEEELVQRALAAKGVPREAVRLYGEGFVSTVEEAETLRRQFPSPPRSLLLVTAPYHAQRARLIFSRTFPETEILVCPDSQETLAVRWWTDSLSARNVVLETAKTVFYLLGGVFRAREAG